MADWLFDIRDWALGWLVRAEASDPVTFHSRVDTLAVVIFLLIVLSPVIGRVFSFYIIKPKNAEDKSGRKLNLNLGKAYIYISLTVAISTLGIYGISYSFRFLYNVETALAWNIIHQASGKQAPSGRKRIIERLVSRGADLTRIDISHAWLDKLNVPSAQMPNMYATYARLNGANFSGANLAGAFFTGAELKNVDFRGAYLGSAVIEIYPGTNNVPQNADLSGVKFDNETDLNNAILYGIETLECNPLVNAKNWETAYRDQRLECGKPIPEWKGQ